MYKYGELIKVRFDNDEDWLPGTKIFVGCYSSEGYVRCVDEEYEDAFRNGEPWKFKSWKHHKMFIDDIKPIKFVGKIVKDNDSDIFSTIVSVCDDYFWVGNIEKGISWDELGDRYEIIDVEEYE